MNDKSTEDLLELEVSNFGPIREARIDLRPLTVFVGASNTGKSWLAILVYALHQCFGDYKGIPRHRFRGTLDPLFIANIDKTDNKLDAAFEWLQQEFGNRDRLSTMSIDDLPDFISDAIQFMLDRRNKRIDSELCRCFGVNETGKLIRKKSKGKAHIVIRSHSPNGSEPLEKN